MAIQKVIEIQVDASQAKNELKNIKEGVNNTSNDVGGLSGTLDKMTGGAITKLKGFTSALGGVATGFKGIGSAIALSGIGLLVITIGALSAAFKGSEEGQNKFAKIMSVIGALTGNLIDLLADFGDLVISVFENPKKAINDFSNLIKENIINRFNGLLELIPQLSKAVVQLFSGDFSEAAKTATDAVGKVTLGVESVTDSIKDATEATKDFIDQNIREAKAAAKVADQRAQADTIERNLIVKKAEAEREIATLRLKAKDLNNVSAKERETALLKVLAIQDELITQETKVLELRRDAQVAENTFARSNKENLLAEEQAKAAVIAAETRRTDQKRQIQRELTAAENEQRAAEKARFKERQAEQEALAKAEADRLKKIQDLNAKFKKQNEDLDAKTLEEKLTLERERAEAELNNLVGTEAEKREAKIALDAFYDQRESELAEQRRLEAEQKQAEADKKAEAERKKREDKEIADAKAVADAKAKIRDSNINNISSGIGLLKDLAGKSEALQAAAVVAENAVGVGKTIINTQAANSAVTAKYALLPGGVALAAAERTANNISAGISIASSVLATKNALSQLKGGSASAKGGSVGNSGGGGSQAPSFNLVQGTGTNQIAEGLQSGNEPIQAYVVSSNVSTAQSLDRNIIDEASI